MSIPTQSSPQSPLVLNASGGGVSQKLYPLPIVGTTAPTTQMKLPVGQQYINKSDNSVYTLTSYASSGLPTWTNMAGAAGIFTSVSIGNGTAAAPSLNFTSDPDTGMYHVGANSIGLSVNGANAATINVAGITSAAALIATTIVSNAAGTAAAPSYTFTGDIDTGIYHVGANSIGFAVNGGGAAVIDVFGIASAGSLVATTIVATGAGLVGTPSYTFNGDTDTGMYHVAANTMGIAANGALVMQVGVGGAFVTGVVQATSFSFTGGVLILTGADTPTTLGIVAPKGSLFTNTGGTATSATTRLFVATDSAGAWTSITTAT